MSYKTNYKEVCKENCGIYAIKNNENGKLYIGQSSNIHLRLKGHISALKMNRHNNMHLQRSWNKYGNDSFSFEIIELCDVKDLDAREEHYINKYDSIKNGYNIRPGGNCVRGWKMTEEQKKHLSIALTGREFSDEHKRNISISKKNYYKDKLQSTCVPVVLLNTGEYFDSCCHASREYPMCDHSALIAHCKGSHLYCGVNEDGERMVWMFLSDYLNSSEEDIFMKLKSAFGYVQNRNKKQVKCTTTGEYFSSCTEAAKHYKISSQSLCDCLKGRSHTSGRDLITNEPLKWEYVA